MDQNFAEGKKLESDARWEEAEEAYRRVPPASPDYFKAQNNLGTILETLERPGEAIEAYVNAIGVASDEWLPHYNLGHVLQQQGRLDSAIDAYRNALEHNPDSADTAFNLGHALGQRGDRDAAIESYRNALSLNPDFAKAWSNLGSELFQAGKLPEAEDALSRAAEMHADAPEVHFSLGHVQALMGKSDSAIASYRHTLSLDPDSRIARQHLVLVLQRAQRTDEARELIEEWLTLMPEDPIAAHMLAALTNPDAPQASEDYVRETFDEFAGEFDSLLTKLQYHGPELISGLLERLLDASDEPLDMVLDAGCGTGLCAAILRERAARLVGVDLSGHMLAKARERELYDELEREELVRYLENHVGRFDLIVAADTFNYFGNLESLFPALAASLRPDGLGVFTLEHGSDDQEAGHRLQPSGRFTHAEPYVRWCLDQAGLVIRSLEVVALRREGGRDVAALLIAVAPPDGEQT